MVDSRLSNRQETKHLLLGLRQPLGRSAGLVSTEWEIIPEGSTQAQFLATSVYSPENVLLDEDHLYPGQPWHVNSYSGKADYSRSLEKGGRLEGGWKSDWMQVDSRAAFADTFYAGNGYHSDSSWSDRFLYRETVHALYGSYSKEGRRWSVEAGLRGEYTLSRGRVPGGAVGGEARAGAMEGTAALPAIIPASSLPCISLIIPTARGLTRYCCRAGGGSTDRDTGI